MCSLTLCREDHCHRLPFTVQSLAPSFPQCCIYSCGERGSNNIKGRNKQLVEQRSDMSCSSFGHKQRLKQLLFHCSEERRRTPSYSRSLSAKQIPTHLQIQDANTKTAAECYKPRRLVHNVLSHRRLLSHSSLLFT